jgi:hypothetical protein
MFVWLTAWSTAPGVQCGPGEDLTVGEVAVVAAARGGHRCLDADRRRNLSPTDLDIR